MPAPFSQGWVENIRTFARAKWYDNITVNRVQDNYVVQWGDPNYDNPEAEGETKALPEGLHAIPEDCYKTDFGNNKCTFTVPNVMDLLTTAEAAAADAEASAISAGQALLDVYGNELPSIDIENTQTSTTKEGWHERDSYAPWVEFYAGWPVAAEQANTDWKFWPVHCYGMVGVGRSYSPDTGSGAELYTVIGHAPRHLDRNIALVGRIISGMENLSSLPRGSGALGFYTEEEFDKRTPILTVRVASDLPEDEQPLFEYLSTDSETFAKYADARANRRDPFFIAPAGGADICNIPVPVRPTPNG
ncbi:peptidylprolyl isomerase [Altererythrobacter aestiaquae]|uniref:Peptidylprolyl isomerase n=2 Tax=Pontixanthobacter aestiaquae TaxID=1509367 RepID=A0A844Z4Q6_9SPHN|nr:peptidylprolyl isomerase [Pontixanthobacter aestiaquae]